ncbi:MAG: S8 family serine peptidase [Bacillota bacterium]
MWHVVTYSRVPGREDLARLQRAGATGGWVLRHLRMVAVKVRTNEVERLAALDGVLSVYPGERAVFVPSPVPEGADRISGLREPVALAAALVRGVRVQMGGATGGRGDAASEEIPAVALVDTGLDETHPAFADVVVRANLRFKLDSAPTDFQCPSATPWESHCDPVGHGTAVAGAVLAGWEAAERSTGGRSSECLSEGSHAARRMVPALALVSLSAGNSPAWVVEVLAAMDYVMGHGASLGVRVINNSWAVGGPWDPRHPINVATRQLAEAGFVVVFSARSADGEFNAFARAPWVIPVDGRSVEGAVSAAPLVQVVPPVPGEPLQPGRLQVVLVGPRLVPGVPLAGTSNLTAINGTSAAAGYVSGWLLWAASCPGQR